MGCTGSDAKITHSDKGKKTNSKLNEEEIKALKLIYEDVASRNTYNKIDLENFLIFFRKNGLWGDRLFRQFDLDQSELLAQSQFILGISKIYKAEEENKAKLLFSHFSKSRGDHEEEGVLYKDFVRMLYNYPKSDLREILHDQHFFETQIKEKLVNNPYKTISLIPQKQTVVLGYLEDKEIQSNNNDLEGGDDKKDKDTSHQHDHDGERHSTDLNASLTFFLYNKKLNVKMTSIHAMVRKFGEMIFKEFGINIKTGKQRLNQGRIMEKQFIEWAKKHPKLYKNYYGGLHDQIWALSPKGTLSYLQHQPEKESEGKLWTINCKGKLKKVGLIYLRNMLILHEPGKKEQMNQIIYLEGLDVTRTFQQKFGFGIKITHRNGIYTEKRIYFKNKQLTDSWMEELKYYHNLTLYERFSVGKRIGAGKFSVVYECEQISTGKKFAMKEIQTYKLSQDAKLILSKQSKILAVVDHPILPKFQKCFITKTHNYIIMELAKGIDLFEYVRQRNKLSEIEAIPIIKQILKGVIYLQKLGICHRDLKPDNIMLIDTNQIATKTKVKILDFGFADYVQNLKNLPHQCKTVGTPNYIAPELLRGEALTQKIDNFSIGCITYYILSGTLPFLGDSIEEVFDKTRNGQFDFSHHSWKRIGAEAKKFISDLMKDDPKERIDLCSALKHKWITETIIPEEESLTPLPCDNKKGRRNYQVY